MGRGRAAAAARASTNNNAPSAVARRAATAASATFDANHAKYQASRQETSAAAQALKAAPRDKDARAAVEKAIQNQAAQERATWPDRTAAQAEYTAVQRVRSVVDQKWLKDRADKLRAAGGRG